jgi:hypothetical protein
MGNVLMVKASFDASLPPLPTLDKFTAELFDRSFRHDDKYLLCDIERDVVEPVSEFGPFSLPSVVASLKSDETL